MSLQDLLNRLLKEPTKPLLIPPSCSNCSYIEGKLCKKRNMPIEYDRAKVCPYFTSEQPTISIPESPTEVAILSLRKILGLEDTLSDLKTDISDMKATIGTLKGMKVLYILEKKGGAIDLNIYSDDVIYSYVVPNNTEQQLKQFDISTLSFASGLTILRYALLVSVEMYASAILTVGAIIRIYVDDVLKASLTLGAGGMTTSYQWYDLACELDAGSHTIKIKMWNSDPQRTFYIRGTRGVCGVGTVATSESKVLTIRTSGQGKGIGRFSGKSWKENPTIYSTLKFDDDDADKVSDSLVVSAGGSEFSKDISLSSFASVEIDYYARTSSANVPAFYRITESKLMKLVAGE